MAQRKTVAEQIASTREEIKQLENKLKQQQQKQNEQERKARTRRLCSRGGYIESRLPEIITLTDEQFKSFIEKTMFGEYARKILDGMTKQNADTGSGISAKTAAQTNNGSSTDVPQIGFGDEEDGDE